MSGFGILMLIFASMLLLIGLYMFTGHEVEILKAKVAFKNLTIDEWKIIGMYTIFVSIFVFVMGITGLIFNFK